MPPIEPLETPLVLKGMTDTQKNIEMLLTDELRQDRQMPGQSALRDPENMKMLGKFYMITEDGFSLDNDDEEPLNNERRVQVEYVYNFLQPYAEERKRACDDDFVYDTNLHLDKCSKKAKDTVIKQRRAEKASREMRNEEENTVYNKIGFKRNDHARQPLPGFYDWLADKKQLVNVVQNEQWNDRNQLKLNQYKELKRYHQQELRVEINHGLVGDDINSLKAEQYKNEEAEKLKLWPSYHSTEEAKAEQLKKKIGCHKSLTDREILFDYLYDCREFVYDHENAMQIVNANMKSDEDEANCKKLPSNCSICGTCGGWVKV